MKPKSIKWPVVIVLAFSMYISAAEPLQKESGLLNGSPVGVAYSGFRSGQHPDRGQGAVNPSEPEILEDLQILARHPWFRLIRLYDSGENSESVLRIIREHEIPVRVMLGIWLDAETSNHEGCPWLTEPIPSEILKVNKVKNLEQIREGIRLARTYPEIVTAVNVGNEALVSWSDHTVPVDTVIAYVRRVQSSIDQPVTVADNYVWWRENGITLASVCDFISVHTYPVWEGKDIDEGLSYTVENIMGVKKALPDVRIVVSEAGWASEASEFGSRATESKQSRYIGQITAWAEANHVTVFLFEAFDEKWKGDPENPLGAEKHWGLFFDDRTPKQVMRSFYSGNMKDAAK